MDNRTPGQTGGTYPAIEALGEIHGAKDSQGQGESQPEQPEAWDAITTGQGHRQGADRGEAGGVGRFLGDGAGGAAEGVKGQAHAHGAAVLGSGKFAIARTSFTEIPALCNRCTIHLFFL